jgi:hypothetical protein
MSPYRQNTSSSIFNPRSASLRFEKTQIEYLGVIISHNKVKIDPVMIAGVVDWPTLTSKKEVQSFIRFVNFYH